VNTNGFMHCMRPVSLPSASRPALGPTQPPVQWVPGALSLGVKRGRGVMLTLLVPRIGKSRNYTSSHPKRLHGVKLDHFTFHLYESGCRAEQPGQ
jgi:hypothetical protein